MKLLSRIDLSLYVSHYAVHLKLIQCRIVNYISIKLEEEKGNKKELICL